MKNVTTLPTEELFTLELPLTGSQPLWAIRYKSGIEGNDNVQPGDWLAKWEPSPDGKVLFALSKQRNLFFTDESATKSVCDMLQTNMGIETEVVKAR